MGDDLELDTVSGDSVDGLSFDTGTGDFGETAACSDTTGSRKVCSGTLSAVHRDTLSSLQTERRG